MAEQEVEWRPVKGFEEYAVSNTGLVMRNGYIVTTPAGGSYYAEPRLLTPQVIKFGYLRVGFHTTRGRKNFLVHQLVAKAFIPNPQNKPSVNHLDGDKFNNNVSNLEWCTQQENVRHAWEHGLANGRGSKSLCAKLTEDQVHDIRNNCIVGKSGASFGHFAKKYGVSYRCVWEAYYRKTYRDII